VNGIDEALARDAARGSRDAFEGLVRRNQGLVRGFLRRLAGDAAGAEDLAQETFLMAWRRIGQWDGKGTFRSWLCRIAYTQFLQQRRSQNAASARDTETFRLMDDTQDDASGVEARIDLDRVLAVLTPEQRATMALCFGEGMTQTEASEALGLPLGTVKSHILRGRERVLAAFSKGSVT
jgi:RNA polymerase sigma factor (sigma-70 family)